MKNLKVSLILLFLYLTVVFNIEKVSSGAVGDLELHGFVDILITIIIISLLLFRFFRNLPGYANLAFWVLAYFTFWYISITIRAIHANLQITMIEVVFVSVASVLAREVAKNIFEVDRTLDRLVFASFGGRTMKMDESSDEIKTELIRSRRYQRSLTVLVVEPDPSSLNESMMASVEEIQHNLARRYAMGKISEVINSTARRPDLVMHQANQFVLLCPETTAESSITLVDRIKSSVKSEIGVSVSVGMASFPDDALTFDELLSKATTKLAGSNTPALQVSLEDDAGNNSL
jgi:hypothetical protein